MWTFELNVCEFSLQINTHTLSVCVTAGQNGADFVPATGSWHWVVGMRPSFSQWVGTGTAGSLSVSRTGDVSSEDPEHRVTPVAVSVLGWFTQWLCQTMCSGVSLWSLQHRTLCSRPLRLPRAPRLLLGFRAPSYRRSSFKVNATQTKQQLLRDNEFYVWVRPWWSSSLSLVFRDKFQSHSDISQSRNVSSPLPSFSPTLSAPRTSSSSPSSPCHNNRQGELMSSHKT